MFDIFDIGNSRNRNRVDVIIGGHLLNLAYLQGI